MIVFWVEEGQKRQGAAKKAKDKWSRWQLRLARRYPVYTSLHKSVDRITARARYTDTPGFQGQDGRSLGSLRGAGGEKNMARYAKAKIGATALSTGRHVFSLASTKYGH